jgi:hypothetical protein
MRGYRIDERSGLDGGRVVRLRLKSIGEWEEGL